MNKKFLAIAIILFALFSFLFVEELKAGDEHNVWGWAWSENIGWVSFNNTSGGGGTNYGVHINDNGTFSGYAWSEHIGWINFAPSGPYPAAPNYSVEMNTSNGEVSGWARACAVFENSDACSGALDPNRGGWDGWIKMRGVAQNGSPYGVWVDTSISPAEFRGWAWSDIVIGWISFNCQNRGVCGTSNYKVMTSFSLPPFTPTELSETWNDCSFRELSVPTFYWDYSHPDGTLQGGYQIKVYGENELDITSNIPSTSYTPPSTWIRDNLLFGERTYSWQVRVRDVQDNWSGWSDQKYFQTRKHAYPWIDFSWAPGRPSVKEIVQFTDESVVYGGATKSSWFWQFPGSYSCLDPETGELTTGCESDQNPWIKFWTIPDPDFEGKVYVSLTVTDSDGFSCPGRKEITVTLPLPEYKEIPPIIWLRNLFARIASVFAGF